MHGLPEFAYDPADMPALRRKLAELPEAHAFPDFELERVEIGPEALRSLPGILDDLVPGGRGPVLLVQDATPMRRGGDDLKPFVRRLLTDAARSWRAGTGPDRRSSPSSPTGRPSGTACVSWSRPPRSAPRRSLRPDCR